MPKKQASPLPPEDEDEAEGRVTKVWFSPDDLAAEALKAHSRPRGSQGAFINAAIRYLANPPISMRLSESIGDYEDRLKSWIENSDHKLELLGISLSRLIECSGNILADRVKNGVLLNATILNPNVSKGDYLFEYLSLVSGGDNFANMILDQSKRSLDFLMNIKNIGSANGTPVNIRLCDEIPSFGLHIRNRGMRDSAIRVNIYTSITVKRLNHVIDIVSQSSHPDDAYLVFMSYYDQLLIRSRGV